MKVVHVNSYDCNGGAARAAYRLHQGLRGLGVDSWMFVVHKDSDDPFVVAYDPPMNFKTRLGRAWRRKTMARDINRYRDSAPGIADPGDIRGNFSDDRTAYGSDPWSKLPENHVIQLHWVVGFVDYRNFFSSIPAGKPVVWTLHDMVVFTGGCHWDYGCGKFVEQCGACPQLGSHSPFDLTRRVWQRKHEGFSYPKANQLQIVTPSRWLQTEVQRSSLLSRFPSTVIPYGLDTEVFAPRDRRVAREILRIPLDAKVILFLADAVHNPRKGFDLLTQALADARADNDVFLLSMGLTDLPEFKDLPHMHIEHRRDDAFLSSVYSAADIFVAPSRQDNLPCVVLEAIACGIPVAGFAVGGILDAVRPGVTGSLARPGDIAELRHIIQQLLQSKEKRAEMSVNCRRIALLEYSLQTQAKRYLELYEEMLSSSYASGNSDRGEEQACPQPPNP